MVLHTLYLLVLVTSVMMISKWRNGHLKSDFRVHTISRKMSLNRASWTRLFFIFQTSVEPSVLINPFFHSTEGARDLDSISVICSASTTHYYSPCHFVDPQPFQRTVVQIGEWIVSDKSFRNTFQQFFKSFNHVGFGIWIPISYSVVQFQK